MQAVISSWLNFEKIIFKPENQTIYGTNDHLCSRNEKTLPLRKATGSTSRSKQREGQK